jgi:ribosomal 50S subunit-associated protein YjgA (DUF615 family)
MIQFIKKDLRANTIQTIGFLMDAVKNIDENREEFIKDAKQIVDEF